MKACFVCCEYPPAAHGGIGTVTQLLARGLRRRGHEVRVIGVYPHLDSAGGPEDDQGVQVWRLAERSRWGGWLGARVALFRQLRHWTRQGEIDFVEVPDWAGWSAGWRGLGVPVITRMHGSACYFASELGQQVSPLVRRIERSALRGADFTCSVSHYTARRSEALFGLERPVDAVIHNPVELPDPRPGLRVDPAVVFAGTLTAKKGILALAHAWPVVLTSVPSAQLHVYGKDAPGPDGGSMAAHVRTLLGPSGARVAWHGHVQRSELLEALWRARVAVFPSYAEAFAMAPLEAMACGCPTVHTRRGPGPELAEDGREALLVDPDDPGQVASTIIRILQDDAFAERLGRAGREAIRARFDLEHLVVQNESFYLECLSDAPRADDHHLYVSAG